MFPKLTDEDGKIEAKLEAIFTASSPARAFMTKSVSGLERARPRLRVLKHDGHQKGYKMLTRARGEEEKFGSFQQVNGATEFDQILQQAIKFQ